VKRRWPLFIALSQVGALCLLMFSLASEITGVSQIGLVVSELMVSPLAPSEDEIAAGLTETEAFDYLELFNPTDQPISCADLEVDGTITSFQLLDEDNATLDPGAFAMVVANVEGFHRRYGMDARILGTFSGTLPSDSAKIELRLPSKSSHPLRFRYATQAPWPRSPGGFGFALVLKAPSSEPDHDLAMHWRASAEAGGSPGMVDPPKADLPIVISEILPKRPVLDTYFRITSYPTVPDQAPSDFINTYIADMKAEPYDFSFIHLVAPDLVGHNFNWYSAAQDEAIKGVDVELGEVFKLIDEHEPFKGKTAIILTSDHGGGGGGVVNNHVDPIWPINYTIHFQAWGPGIPAGQELYELNEETRLIPPKDRNPPYVADTSQMPIRNGDLGNLAMDLLGLPPIPGSWINADQSLNVEADKEAIDYVIGISIDGLAPSSIVRLGPEALPNLHRLRTEGTYTDRARTDATHTITNPNHTCMLTGRGVLTHEGVGRGHFVTFNSNLRTTLQVWNHGVYIASAFDVTDAFGMSSAFYSNKSKLDFLGRSYGAISGDAIELYNPNPVAKNITGWGLTDDPNDPMKFIIPSSTSIVPANGRLVLNEDPGWRSAQRPTLHTRYFGSAFSLDPNGGEVYLFETKSKALTGVDHGLQFGPILTGGSAIRQTTIDGERTVMAGVTTLGLPNAAPFSNAVIITEISPQNGNDAFIELQNVANEEIQIDSSFRLDGSYQFTFPSQIILQPGDLLIVTAQAQEGEPMAPIVLGPLKNVRTADDETTRVALVIDQSNTSTVTLDQVIIERNSAWPEAFWHNDHAIERRNPRVFGEDPGNWKLAQTAVGTPGFVTTGKYENWTMTALGGLPDAEFANDADPDEDGLTNFHEYAFASDPQVADLHLQPEFSSTADGLLLTIRRPRDVADVNYIPEISNDLVIWNAAAPNVILQLSDRKILDAETEEVRYLVMPSTTVKQFLRVRAIPRP
jgi:hypothetical protein